MLKLLSPDGVWFGWSATHAQIEFFGNSIEIPVIRYAALFLATPKRAKKVRRDLSMNRAANAVHKMSMREGTACEPICRVE